MRLDAIKALKVANISTDRSVLYLWATMPKLTEALEVINAWEFTYRSGMVWVKDIQGMGYWARQRHELLLIAVTGSPLTPSEHDRIGRRSMKRLLFVLIFGLVLATRFAGPQVGPARVAASLATQSEAAQAVPQNASPSRRGGWMCDNGYVRRDRSCVTVEDATDAEVRQQMIASSTDSYSGSCPCPDFRDRGGRRCGGRSAYSRPGGASPLCYERDISDAAVLRYRERYAP